MIPGKKYKPEDFLEAAWRRRWVIMIPLVLVSAVTLIVVRQLPDLYESKALLVILPQRIPEGYVRSTVTARLDERLSAMSQQIFSRSSLEPIVQDLNLYPVERKTMLMEDVIEIMRTRDLIFNMRNARGDSGSFDVGFRSSEPRQAQQVAARLAAMFVNENTEDRALRADQTDAFLVRNLLDAERELKERESRLMEFKRTHPGAMPDQMLSTQQALQSAQVQLQGLQESVVRDRDRQVTVQRAIADLTMTAAMSPLPDSSTSPAPQTYARQLEQAQEVLKNMRLKLKEGHPDLKFAERQVKDLEEKAAAEALQQPLSGPMSGASAEASRAARLADLQNEDAALKRRIAQKQEDEKNLLAAMSGYRARLDSVPNVETELTSLTRDYTSYQASYQTLLAKSLDAKLAANLERNNVGEQFNIIDPPRLPQRPTSPDRYRMNMMGALGGLIIGLGFAGLLEYRDTTLRSDDDVLVALALPVLASVPTMSTELERQRRKRHRLWLASSGAVALMLCLAVIMWKLRLTDWIW